MKIEQRNTNKKGFPTDQSLEASTVTPNNKGNVTMNSLAQINDTQVSIINFESTPVITTELLAHLYGTETNNIKVNFSRNTERFIEGKHFFKVQGDELKDLRLQVTKSNSQISPKTRALILWTERGAARHAKMLDTDQAWDVFEKLEDCYFGKQQKTQPTFDLTETLSQTLNQISKGNKKLYMSMYNGLMRRFAVGRLADIPHAEIHNALATIYFFAVEWHRKNTPTQLPLKLNDGEHYLVVKDGVVLWERKLKPNCNDIPANTLKNPTLMLEHIREVVGEFVGKEALPAPKPQNSETVRELVERVLIQNFTLNHIWKSLHTLDKGLYLRAINYVVNTNVRVLRVIEDFGFKTKQGNDMISCDFRTIQLYDGRTITGCNPNYFNAFA